MMIEYGIVKKYDRGTKMGVLTVLANDKETGEELPFSMAGGRLVELKDRVPQFIYERVVEPMGRGGLVGRKVQRGDLVSIRVGDQLAFERSEHDQGAMKHWSKAHAYNECLRELGGPYYRVIRRNTAQPWKFKVICKDLTLPELKARYPAGPEDPLGGCEFEFWNFDHIRPTRGGGYYSCPPGWDSCYLGDPRARG